MKKWLEKVLFVCFILSLTFAALTFGGLCLTLMFWMIKCWGM